jgi:hypothetical protein
LKLYLKEVDSQLEFNNFLGKGFGQDSIVVVIRFDLKKQQLLCCPT